MLPPSLSTVYPVPLSDTWWIGGGKVYHNTTYITTTTSSLTNASNSIDNSEVAPVLPEDADNDELNDKLLYHKPRKTDTTWRISVLQDDFCPHFSKLVVGDRVAIKRTLDGSMVLYINGIHYGIAVNECINANDVIHAVVELNGSCTAVETTSFIKEDFITAATASSAAVAVGAVSQDSLEVSTTLLQQQLPPPTLPSPMSANVITSTLPNGAMNITSIPSVALSNNTTNTIIARGGVLGATNTIATANTNSTSLPPHDTITKPILAAASSTSLVTTVPHHTATATALHHTTAAAPSHHYTQSLRYNTRTVFQFSERHGSNVQLAADRARATRRQGYDGGMVALWLLVALLPYSYWWPYYLMTIGGLIILWLLVALLSYGYWWP